MITEPFLLQMFLLNVMDSVHNCGPTLPGQADINALSLCER